MNLTTKYRYVRVFAVVTSLSMLIQLFTPAVSFALTSGPTQPEVQAFEPMGTTDMVDLFTGDFTYNIPLFELPGPNGGYPFNLAYHSGIGMDQEASWVGLGWSLNPGAITRNMRGLPDEFKGDDVTKTIDIKPNVTVGVKGGAGTEIFGLFGTSLGIKLYRNNYKGFGYSLDPSLGFSVDTKIGINLNTNLNLSLDTQEGIGISPSLGISGTANQVNAGFQAGLGYNSKRGLTDLSLGWSISKSTSTMDKNGREARGSVGGIGSGASISFANTAYTPSVALPYRGTTADVVAKVGTSLFGVFGNFYVGGFVNTSWLKDRGEEITHDAYGYLNLEHAPEEALTDFNRTQDAPVHKQTPNLGIPATTPDIYSVAGQGTGGMFRAWRNHHQILSDPAQRSTMSSVSGGVDVGPGVSPHIGVNAAVSFSDSRSGAWSNDNLFRQPFEATSTETDFETWYFKTHGEYTTDPIGDLDHLLNDDPVAVQLALEANMAEYYATDKLETSQGNSEKVIGLPDDQSREPRNQVVDFVSNDEVGDNSEILSEFDVSYYSSSSNFNRSSRSGIDRASKPGHHPAGFTSLNAQGQRYVYGLPAYNNSQTERTFSVAYQTNCTATVNASADYDVAGTNHYNDKTVLPPYAHSYLLTSILGADYIDADSASGPSEGDFGYWVRMDYTKTASNLKWRAPFSKANYDEGVGSNYFDDRGSYIFGEKEQWYLHTAETKTHIAEFYISGRTDNWGASSELQNTDDRSGQSYKLDSIRVFSKAERYPGGSFVSNAEPLQTVHFRYSYDLCKGLPNSSGSAGNDGKLTLDSLWFTYEGNTRGALSPYVFNYHYQNPDYDLRGNDRWGNYKPVGQTACGNIRDPYVEQYDPTMADSVFRDSMNSRMSAWHLDQISLPSGATMNIQYEADDYGYVQHLSAMQMTRIIGLENGLADASIVNVKDPSDSQRRVYFDLEHPLAAADTAKVQEYISGIDNLYFKTRIKTRKSSEAYYDMVSGYVPIEGVYVDQGSLSSGKYLRAYVIIDFLTYGNKTIKYHPFSVAAWQYLRTSNPDLLNQPSLPIPENGNMSTLQKVNHVKNLFTLGPQLKQMFSGVFKYCFDENFGQQIDLDYSWIRLNSPDKRKYGGGTRVKSITMNDGWNNATSNEVASEYGTVYSYDMQEDGNTISSGVAAYEPMIGGDENPWRNAKLYMQNVPLLQNFPSFFQYPINEAYFPAPVVGYRKVTVTSLATDKVIKGTISGDPVTTGATTHEFYTCKDYPVQTDETHLNPKPKNLPPLPLGIFGSKTINNMFASQGYSVILNDMHGKLRKVSTYRQDANGAVLYNSPISEVEYLYSDQTWYDNTHKRQVRRLQNKVETLVADIDKNNLSRSKVEKRIIGQDYEFVVDMRQSTNVTTRGGLAYNTEVIIIPPFFAAPIPMIWPNLGESRSMTRTAATNKIIHRFGILKEVRAMTDGSLVRTNHKYFDALTGRPLLTTVTNAWEDPVYKYEYPAHWAYDQMGAAYKNIGLEVDGLTFSQWQATDYFRVSNVPGPAQLNHLVPGDEFISNASGTLKKAVFLGEIRNDFVFAFEDHSYTPPSGGAGADLILTRSGRRNQLLQNAQEITALADPTQNRDHYGCYKDLEFPGNTIDSLDTVPVPSACMGNFLGLLSEIYPIGADVTLGLNSSPYAQYGNVCVTCKDSAKVESAPDDNTWALEFGANLFDPCCQMILVDKSGNYLDPSTIDSFYNPFHQSTYTGTISFVPSVIFSNLGFEYETTSQSTDTGYVFGNSNHIQNATDGCAFVMDTNYVVHLIDTSGDYTMLDTIFSIDSVLSATAITFSDAWSQDFSNVRFDESTGSIVSNIKDLQRCHPYYTGERGIWRPWENYVYRADRRQSTAVNLREDGTFGNVPVFNFNGLVFGACAEGWVRANEITRYSPYGYDTENRDVLDIFSSALYGYDGKLPVAVGSNARYQELAYEGFEEYAAGSTVNQFGTSTGNVDIYNGYYTVSGTDPYRIYVWEDVRAASEQTAIMDRSFPTSSTTPASYTDVKVDARSEGSPCVPSEKFANTRDVTADFLNAGTGTAGYTLDSIADFHLKAQEAIWDGKIHIPQYMAFQQTAAELNKVDFVSTTAHTGSVSMSLEGDVKFPQTRLRPINGKKYLFSAWVSRDDVHQYSYKQLHPLTSKRLGVAVEYLDSTGAQIGSTPLMEPIGKNVEGWQKIEGIFIAPDSCGMIRLCFQSGQDSANSHITAYFDDIRINPLVSNMQSYVYDPNTFRLKAVLDPNNYATLYHYDEQGNLFLVRKETEHGIRTIQESRQFVTEQ